MWDNMDSDLACSRAISIANGNVGASAALNPKRVIVGWAPANAARVDDLVVMATRRCNPSTAGDGFSPLRCPHPICLAEGVGPSHRFTDELAAEALNPKP